MKNIKKRVPKSDFITKKDFDELDTILNKIRLKLNSKISIKDTKDGVIIQTFSDLGIIKNEVKTNSIKSGVDFLNNKQ